MTFQIGDILEARDKSFNAGFHRLIYISGNENAPYAIILTSKQKHSCNFPLNDTYFGSKITSYFIAHVIEKLKKFGPYTKVGRLTDNDMTVINQFLKTQASASLTWSDYIKFSSKSCPIHGKHPTT